MRAFLIVLDSVGIGAAPDAADYGDEGSNTLVHIGKAVGGISLPTLQKLGLGNIPGLIGPDRIPGVPEAAIPLASFGAMEEQSKGKDTTTGHWEMAGLCMEKGFHVFPPDFPSFPAELIRQFEMQTSRKAIGNCAASGIKIIEDLGEQQAREGAWIVYTSADSVFQIAAHEEVIPLPELYAGCLVARNLCNPLKIGRIIARPYIGKPGAYKRTENRRDFSYPLPEPTILDLLQAAGVETVTVGKLDDIFDKHGISQSFHDENNVDAQASLLELAAGHSDRMFVFANLIDFDMLYGHRRDAAGYAKALERTDRFLAEMLPLIKEDDLLMITADHGNDPTFKGTDHTREYVPLLAFRPGRAGKSLGIRKGFYDIARSLTDFFGTKPTGRGISFV